MSDRWYHEMACRDVDPDLFVKPQQRGNIPKGGRTDKWAIPALLICRACPVRLQCLDEAINAVDTFNHGTDNHHHPITEVPMVVGGVLPQQLEALRARRRRSA